MSRVSELLAKVGSDDDKIDAAMVDIFTGQDWTGAEVAALALALLDQAGLPLKPQAVIEAIVADHEHRLEDDRGCAEAAGSTTGRTAQTRQDLAQALAKLSADLESLGTFPENLGGLLMALTAAEDMIAGFRARARELLEATP